MFILKKGYQPGVYVPLRALFLVFIYFDADNKGTDQPAHLNIFQL